MKKSLLGIVGLILTLPGLGLVFLFMTSSGGNNLIELPLAVILVGGGLFLIGKGLTDVVASKTGIDTSQPAVEPVVDKGALEERLARNNQMVHEYSKTSNTKDQLKVMQIAANANTQSSTPD